jgi:large subunit ribosomal protein L24
MRLFVKKNDTVLILSGRDKGKRGKVLKVLVQEGTLIVEKVNMIKRHTRPNPQKQIKGGIIEREAAIPACRVMVVCPECHSPARVGRVVAEGGVRHRVCKKCHGTLA